MQSLCSVVRNLTFDKESGWTRAFNTIVLRVTSRGSSPDDFQSAGEYEQACAAHAKEFISMEFHKKTAKSPLKSVLHWRELSDPDSSVGVRMLMHRGFHDRFRRASGRPTTMAQEVGR